MDFEKVLALEEKLLPNLEFKLRNKLNINPNNEEDSFNLAEVLRKLGKINHSIYYYNKTYQLNNNNLKAKYLYNLLLQNINDFDYPDNIEPIPFIKYDNFFDENEKKIIWKNILKNKDNFSVSKTETGREHTRNSLSLKKSYTPEITDILKSKIISKIDSASKIFKLDKKNYYFNYNTICYSDGSFFKIHIDNKYTPNTEIVFIYYFYKEPREFTGGELLLFDSDTKNIAFKNNYYTRIIPENNSVISFPAKNTFHLVTKINSYSKDFEKSRFAIINWIDLD
ncbi:MAG: 2OG-Fe(II) oxygenase [Candidatus Sericytochromatia bacterium]